MSAELDLTAAIDAGAAAVAVRWHGAKQDHPCKGCECPEDAEAAITAALPHIREQLAQQVDSEPEEFVPGYFSFRPAGLIRRSRATRIVRGES